MKPIVTIRNLKTGTVERVWLKQEEVSITIYLPDRELIDPSMAIHTDAQTYKTNLAAQIQWRTDLGKFPDIKDWRDKARNTIPILKTRTNNALYG